MAAAGHMNIELPPARRTLLEEQIFPIFGSNLKTYLHDDLAHRGTVGGDVEEDPNGGHCAEDGVDPSGFGGR